MSVICPNCGTDKSYIYATRSQQDRIRRTRVCENCNTIFYTMEITEYPALSVSHPIYRERVNFDRNKLLNKIIAATYESDISVKEINDFIDTLEFSKRKKYTTEEIFQLTAQFLKERDETAYVRYAASKLKFIEEGDKNEFRD